jgi:hypothetical protein
MKDAVGKRERKNAMIPYPDDKDVATARHERVIYNKLC